MKRRDGGLSLLEVLMAVAILAILAMVLMSSWPGLP